MEQSDIQSIAWDVFEIPISRPDLASWPHFGFVIQAYLVQAPTDAEHLPSLGRRRGTPLSVRLVKGAYWDYEMAHARQHGYPCPVLAEKQRTDATFEALSELLVKNTALVNPGIGSHNSRSISSCARCRPKRTRDAGLIRATGPARHG
jgi:RHH-type proline utilization regulon transcriptional repressor/proline dehydrogenase/delta 1-pyrroline-5-carboxylate dehydrogenase